MDDGHQWRDTPAEISQRVAKAGHEWSDKDYAASLLEESRKRLRSQLSLKYVKEAGSVAKAEIMAEASDEYGGHIQKMCEARRVANHARVNYDSGRMWSDLVRTQEATKRAEMGLR